MSLNKRMPLSRCKSVWNIVQRKTVITSVCNVLSVAMATEKLKLTSAQIEEFSQQSPELKCF